MASVLKKIIIGALAASIAAAPLPSAALNIVDEEIYEQTFEECNIGESLEKAGMKRMDAATGTHDVAADSLNSANKCGRYIKRTSGEMFLVQNLPKMLEGTVTISLDFFTESEAYQSIAVWGMLETGGSKTLTGVSISGFQARAEGNTAPLYRDAWNNIVITVDTENDIYSAWVNGAQLADSAKLPLAARNVSFFRMNMQANDAAMYFDNIRVSRTWKPLNYDNSPEKSGENGDEPIIPENGEYRVSDFGAIPDDDADDSDAVNKAVAAAMKAGGGKVIFDKGRYIFKKTVSDSRYVIAANGSKNLSLIGNDTEMYVCDPFSGVFDIRSSNGASISGFTVKYETAPWVQGTIEETDEENGTFLLRTMEGYSIFDDSRFSDPSKPWGVAMQNDNPYMMRRDVVDHFKFKKVEKKADSLYEIALEQPELVKRGTLAKNDKIIYTNRSLGVGPSIAAHGAGSVTVKNVTVHESADCIFVGAYLRGQTTIENVNAVIDSDRWIASNADGFHIQGARGPVYIKNCSLSGLLDDCVNLYQYPGLMTGKTSDKAFTIRQPQANLPQEGETIIVYSPTDFSERGRAKVKTVEKISTVEAKITLESDIKNVSVGEDVPSADTFTIADCAAPGTVISGNSFEYCRRFGCLIKSRDTLIENNSFSNLGGDAVNFTGSMAKTGVEGPFAENIIIRNNKIDNAAYRNSERRGGKTEKGAAIAIPASLGAMRPVRNITIENNTFTNLPQYAISANGANGLSIVGNKITCNADDEVITADSGDIFIRECDNVTVTGNVISDLRPSAKTAVYIDSTVDTITAENNSITLSEDAKEFEFASGITKFDIAVKRNTPTIDGDLSDWEGITPFEVSDSSAAFLFPNYMPEDLSYEGRYSWDDDNFYIAVKATDNVHNPAKEADGAIAWQFDSVQAAFDSERIGQVGAKGYTGIVISQNCTARRSSTVQGLSGGEVKNVLCVCKRNEEEKTTIYEIAVPWSEVMPKGFTAENRKYIGVSMLLNDNDGNDRKGYLEYYSGIGNGKKPEEYATAILVNSYDEANISMSFNDIGTHWAKSVIEKMAFYGIVKGVGDDMFAPERSVSLAEFISMLVRIKKPQPAGYSGSLSDVSETDWFADDVQTAIDNGYVDGGFIGGGAINPNKQITRGEAAALIAKAEGLAKTGSSSVVAPKPWQKYYAEACIDNGIIKGYGDGDYRLGNSLTRAEAAKLLSEILK